MVTASQDETAIIWDAGTGARPLALKAHTNSLTAASFSPDGTRVVPAGYDRTARVWDAKTGTRS
jgi:WD40 repeat protein